jgi:hypothetical protein
VVVDIEAWMDEPGHVWVSPGGDPVVGYPPEDVWLGETSGQSFATCVVGAIAEAESAASGMINLTDVTILAGAISESRR